MIRKLTLALLLLVSFTGYSQSFQLDTVYFDSYWKQIRHKEFASYFRVIEVGDSELLTIYPWMRIINEPSVALRGKEFGTLNFPNDNEGRRLEQTLADNLWKAIKEEITPDDVLKLTQACFPDAFQ